MAEGGGDDSSQEKTEQPTPRKLEKAREDGQIPRSRDLTTTAILLAGTVGLALFGPAIGKSFTALAANNFSLSHDEAFDTSAMVANLASSFYEGLLALAPLLIILLIASIAGPIGLGGWMLSAKAMAPKFSRLSPLAGLKRMFSVKSLVELGKSIGKVAVVMLTAIAALYFWERELLSLGLLDIERGIIESLTINAYAAIALAAVTIAIAMIDVPFQLWDHNKKLKMSFQEVKDEHKDTEGKPEVKGRIRQLQREMSQRRMMANVPEADVIITNPTHYAVALKYDPQTMQTPILLAKGVDHIALKIREIGKAHNVEIVEAKVLARAIYHTTEENGEVPEGLYMAVAQVLAYVFGLRNYRRGRGDRPQYPQHLTVPPDMRFD